MRRRTDSRTAGGSPDRPGFVHDRTMRRGIKIGRLVAFALTVVLLGFAAVRLWATIHGAFAGLEGVDLRHYLDGTRRWLDTGSPYPGSTEPNRPNG
jgi:hypothetical protein